MTTAIERVVNQSSARQPIVPTCAAKLSIVIPVYNSSTMLVETIRRTVDYLESTSIEYELILVNDASTDTSWNIIETAALRNPHIIAIDLLRNAGQQSAMVCGIRHANGDYVMTMDDDLQNPPEEIGKLLHRIDQGYDTVFAKFAVKRHSLSRRLGSKVIGYLNEQIFHKPSDITLSNFRIFTRAVAQRVANYRTAYPYLQGLLLMCSSKIANVETEHHERMHGRSNYTLMKIAKLVAILLFNYSSYPLKMLTTMGFLISLVSFGAGAFYVAKSIMIGTRVPGWTTVVALVSFLNGFIIIMLGVLGEYVCRLLNQVSSDQSYLIREIVKHD